MSTGTTQSPLAAGNLGVKFLLELAALASLAYWGASVGSGVASVALAVLLPLAAAVLWGVFAAPNSTRRLPARTRIPFEMSVFALATVALVAAGSVVLAIVFAVTAVVNAVLLTVLDQWGA
jgi:hypothetical protein